MSEVARSRPRVARATENLPGVVRFYRGGPGLEAVGSFADREGFDGVMPGLPGLAYHLEFTRGRRAGADNFGRTPRRSRSDRRRGPDLSRVRAWDSLNG